MRLTLLATALVLCSCAIVAGEKKGDRKEARGNEFEFLEEHQKELKLTDAQKKELKELAEKTRSKREKMMESPEAREILEQMRQAKKSGDETRSKELRGKLMDIAGKDEETSPRANIMAIGKILKPEQLATLRELREKEGMPTVAEMKERRKDRDENDNKTYNKPDPKSGVPKLYDEEK